VAAARPGVSPWVPTISFMEARVVATAAESGQFQIAVEGESIQPGKVSIRDLEKLGPLLQSGLERMARVLSGEPGKAPGTVPRAIEDATNLMLIGIRPGSAVLALELPLPEERMTVEEGLFPLPAPDLGQRALEAFVRGLHELESGGSGQVPEAWDNSVMEIAEELANFASERDVVIHLQARASRRPARVARIAPDIAERFQVRHAPIRQRRTARGRLYMVDLKAGRIDVEDEKGQRVQCLFPPHLEGEVRRLVGSQVVIGGEEQVDLALGKRGRLELSVLEPASEAVPMHEVFWMNPSAAEQAAEQGVGPIASVAQLAAPGVFTDEEVEAFLAAIREARREE
jgi:hypothetical protein